MKLQFAKVRINRLNSRSLGKLVTLTERAVTPAGAVDREAGIVRDVKIIGMESQNGRTYTEAALRSAIPLFEGAKVNVDHPPKGREGATRDIRECVGVLEGVRFADGGLRGNIRLRRESPHFAEIIELASDFAGSVGLSPNQLGRVVNRGGKQIVEAINVVRSVDLVTTPATTRNLFESREPQLTARDVRAILLGGRCELLESAGSAAHNPATGDAGPEMPLHGEIDLKGLVDIVGEISREAFDGRDRERLADALARFEKYCRRTDHASLKGRALVESIERRLHHPAPAAPLGSAAVRAFLTGRGAAMPLAASQLIEGAGRSSSTAPASPPRTANDVREFLRGR